MAFSLIKINFFIQNCYKLNITKYSLNTVYTKYFQCYWKDVLSNSKCLRHSMNRTQSKDDRIETYEINEILLSCFDDKMIWWNSSWLLELITKENGYCNNFYEKLFCQPIKILFQYFL